MEAAVSSGAAAREILWRVLGAFRGLLEALAVQNARAVKASRRLASLRPLDNVLAWGHAQPRCLTTVRRYGR